MDPATHLIASALVVGRNPRALLAGIAPDIPFYAIYPWWWAAQRTRLESANDTMPWPMPPGWLQQIHFASHSLLGLAALAWLLRKRSKLRRNILGAWALHLLLDLPSHKRERMAPRPFWPLSDWAVDGVSWADALQTWLYRKPR